jgi:hypothetical protein
LIVGVTQRVAISTQPETQFRSQIVPPTLRAIPSSESSEAAGRNPAASPLLSMQ